MKKIILAILFLLAGAWPILSAGPNDTELEEEIVRDEFTTWLQNSTLVDINYSEIDKIVEKYDDDYIRIVMRCYVMPFPSGDLWYDFQNEYFPMLY
jgi:hypothetical protein